MNQTVWVIDDEFDLLEMMVDAIALLGHPVIGRTQAMPPSTLVIRNDPIDLVIIDIMLTGHYNGIEWADAMRKKGLLAPIMATSASPMLTKLARESGLFEDVIDKPFDLTAFLECVEHCLSGGEDTTDAKH